MATRYRKEVCRGWNLLYNIAISFFIFTNVNYPKFKKVKVLHNEKVRDLPSVRQPRRVGPQTWQLLHAATSLASSAMLHVPFTPIPLLYPPTPHPPIPLLHPPHPHTHLSPCSIPPPHTYLSHCGISYNIICTHACSIRSGREEGAGSFPLCGKIIHRTMKKVLELVA